MPRSTLEVRCTPIRTRRGRTGRPKTSAWHTATPVAGTVAPAASARWSAARVGLLRGRGDLPGAGVTCPGTRSRRSRQVRSIVAMTDTAGRRAGVPERPTLDGLEETWAAPVAGGGHVRVRPVEGPGGRILDRHSAAHRIGRAAHRARLLVHPHRHLARFQRMRGKAVFYPMGWDDNGLPTERRVQNVYGVRCDPSLPYDPAWRPPTAPVDDAARKNATPISRRNFIELCERLTVEDEQAFEALWRRLGLSVDWSMTYTTIGDRPGPASQRAFLRNLARGEAYTAEAPTLWDVGVRHRGGPGGVGGPGASRRLPPAAVPRSRRRGGLHRDHPARAAAGLRGAGLPPRRRAVPGAGGRHRAHARCSASRCRCTRIRSPSRARAPASRWCARSVTWPT